MQGGSGGWNRELFGLDEIRRYTGSWDGWEAYAAFYLWRGLKATRKSPQMNLHSNNSGRSLVELIPFVAELRRFIAFQHA